jgi:hypothetical protein
VIDGPFHVINGTLRAGVVIDCSTLLGTRRLTLYDWRGNVVADGNRTFGSEPMRLDTPRRPGVAAIDIDRRGDRQGSLAALRYASMKKDRIEMRVLLTEDPYLNREVAGKKFPWDPGDAWPCKWVSLPSPAPAAPFVSAYRCRFSVAARRAVRVHVSADERYRLFLDGSPVGRGSERGDRNNWFYETYEWTLEPGEHVLVAQVWSLGSLRPWGQIHVYDGFICSPEGDDVLIASLGTGVAAWEAKRLDSYAFRDAGTDTGTSMGGGPSVDIDGAKYDSLWRTGDGSGWRHVIPQWAGNSGFHLHTLRRLHRMRPARLPAMLERPVDLARARVRAIDTAPLPALYAHDTADPAAAQPWMDLVAHGRPVRIPPHTTCRVLFDLDDYVCFYPILRTSGGGGGEVAVAFSEALFDTAGQKGPRGAVVGRRMQANFDRLLPASNGVGELDTLWWRCGRYVSLTITTADVPLSIEHFSLIETRYPAEFESSFDSDDPQLADILKLCWRTIQVGTHEVFIDSPYYEQMMYVGDTRNESLVWYTGTTDARIVDKCIRIFGASRVGPSGLVVSSYPSEVGQLIPPFAMMWIIALHEYAMWRDGAHLVRDMLPHLRGVLEHLLAYLSTDNGLFASPPGWNWIDHAFPNWTPPGGKAGGFSAPINWQLIWALRTAAELETKYGEPEMVTRYTRHARGLAAACSEHFWDARRGLFADDVPRTSYSEHTQALALLSGMADPGQRTAIATNMFTATDLIRPTTYFNCHVIDAARTVGRSDLFFERLSIWRQMLALDYKATPEEFPHSRSDSHAYSAHPLYHLYATVLGIRPAAFGFQRVTVCPQLGPLTRASGKLVHPRGAIEVTVHRAGDTLETQIILPPDTSGELLGHNVTHPLRPGNNEHVLPAGNAAGQDRGTDMLG